MVRVAPRASWNVAFLRAGGGLLQGFQEGLIALQLLGKSVQLLVPEGDLMCQAVPVESSLSGSAAISSRFDTQLYLTFDNPSSLAVRFLMMTVHGLWGSLG